MSVTSTKGERLGNVIRMGAETFVVERGVFFPKDYELRYDHITGLSGDQISYTLSDADARRGNTTETARAAAPAPAPRPAATATPPATPPARPAAAAVATPATAATSATTRASAGTGDGTSRKEEVRIPLMEEEVGIEKVARETGHVRIHKTVKTEEKHFSVPVTREDVVIERVSASDAEPALAPELAFQEQTLDLPLHEEDVRVTKRSHVREQIIVHPVVQATEKEASASLRHEEAEIEDTRGRSFRNADESVTRPGSSAPGSSHR